jgi:hypothetical protein
MEAAGMRPIAQPQLVTGPFADPGAFVHVLFEHRSLRLGPGGIPADPA